MNESDKKSMAANWIIFSLALVTMQNSNWPVTFSIGLATYRTPPASVDEALGSADSLMYQAKKRGKNTIVARTF